MRLHYQSYPAYRGQPLYRIARSVVLKRANGMCEKCEVAPATEVHHLRYPAWGTFDTPSNLVAICHPCHCKEHGKDD